MKNKLVHYLKYSMYLEQNKDMGGGCGIFMFPI